LISPLKTKEWRTVCACREILAQVCGKNKPSFLATAHREHSQNPFPRALGMLGGEKDFGCVR
jgi:hypothetical protein